MYLLWALSLFLSLAFLNLCYFLLTALSIDFIPESVLLFCFTLCLSNGSERNFARRSFFFSPVTLCTISRLCCLIAL